jgi:hypothetical protein
MKEITIKETIIKEVPVERVVYKAPDYLLNNPQVLFRMPEFTMSEKDIFNIVRSLEEDIDKWAFSLSTLGGDSFFVERTTASNKRIQLYIDGLSKKDDKDLRVRMLQPINMDIDKKWNDTFKHLLFPEFRTLYNKKVKAEMDKSSELSEDISGLLSKTQKRDDTLNKLL